MQDPELLQVQLHGFAAAPADPDIARSCRRTFEVLGDLVHERTQLTDDELRQFFAMGMMINVMSAIDLLSLPDHWAQSSVPDPREDHRHQSRHPSHHRHSTVAEQAANRGGLRMNQPCPSLFFCPA